MTLHHGVEVIETKALGAKFRSRSEARWAVFFNSIGLSWVYEGKYFSLGEAGAYLPDFWHPAHDVFTEIKGAAPDFHALWKCSELASQTGRKVILLYGGLRNHTALLFGADVFVGPDEPEYLTGELGRNRDCGCVWWVSDELRKCVCLFPKREHRTNGCPGRSPTSHELYFDFKKAMKEKF